MMDSTKRFTANRYGPSGHQEKINARLWWCVIFQELAGSLRRLGNSTAGVALPSLPMQTRHTPHFSIPQWDKTSTKETPIVCFCIFLLCLLWNIVNVSRFSSSPVPVRSQIWGQGFSVSVIQAAWFSSKLWTCIMHPHQTLNNGEKHWQHRL